MGTPAVFRRLPQLILSDVILRLGVEPSPRPARARGRANQTALRPKPAGRWDLNPRPPQRRRPGVAPRAEAGVSFRMDGHLSSPPTRTSFLTWPPVAARARVTGGRRRRPRKAVAWRLAFRRARPGMADPDPVPSEARRPAALCSGPRFRRGPHGTPVIVLFATCRPGASLFQVEAFQYPRRPRATCSCRARSAVSRALISASRRSSSAPCRVQCQVSPLGPLRRLVAGAGWPG